MRRYDPRDFYKSSFKKDMRYSFFPLLQVFLVLWIISFFAISVFAYSFLYTADAPIRRYDPDGEDVDYEFYLEEDEEHQEEEEEEYEEDLFNGEMDPGDRLFEDSANITALGLGLYLLLGLFFIVMIFHAMNYTKEISGGNVRSLFRYPVSVRDLVQSKALNTVIMSLLLLSIPSIMVFLALVFVDFYWLEALMIFLISLAVVITVYIFFTAVSSILGSYFKSRVILNPGLWVIIGTALLLCMTETLISGTYEIICEANKWNYTQPFLVNLMYLSPFHFLGRIYDLILMGQPMEWLDFIWIPIFVPVIVWGSFSLRRIYPDIFITETA